MSVRAFFAIDLESKHIINKVVQIQKLLDLPNLKINFVNPENLHFTLKFLGNIDQTIVKDLEKELDTISFNKFNVTLQGMGCLPSMSYINAIYIDTIEGTNELKELAKQIESLGVKFNFKKEKRPFKSHLTIGRVKKIGNKEELVSKITKNEKELFGNFTVNSFKLKKSELTPTGPIYTTLIEKFASDKE